MRDFKIEITLEDTNRKQKEPEVKKPIEKKPFLKRGDGKYCISKVATTQNEKVKSKSTGPTMQNNYVNMNSIPEESYFNV